MRLAKVLAEKKNAELVYTIPENASIKEAAKMMTENDIGALIVVADENDPKSYAGILTEKMIINECWKHENFLEKNVGEIISRKLLITKESEDINEVMNIMTQNHMRYIPVWDEDKIIGIVSIGDIINSLHEEKKIRITYLSKISGTYGNKVY